MTPKSSTNVIPHPQLVMRGQPMPTPDDQTALDAALIDLRTHLHYVIRLVTKNVADLDQAPYFNYLASLEEMLALTASIRCRCGKAIQREVNGVEVCDRCADPAYVHRRPAEPTIGQIRAVWRLFAARITEEAHEELQGRGTVGWLADRVGRKPESFMKELLDVCDPVTTVYGDASGIAHDSLRRCSICESVDGHAHDCPVDALERL